MTNLVAPELSTIAWQSPGSADVARSAQKILAERGVVRVSGFPTTAGEYIRFLRAFGEPLRYYGDEVGTHPQDSAIWRIKYDPASALRGEAHAVDGPLAPHSSQSLRTPRPRLFSMLMVDAGWQDRPFGLNGESLLASWRNAFRQMRADLGPGFRPMLQALLDEVPFPGGSCHSVAYHLDSATSADDLGVRLKNNLLPYLRESQPAHPATAAVGQLMAAAERTALRVALRSGDLILLDNDRWGHGRQPVVGHVRRNDGQIDLNPRELWSVTVD